MFSSQCFPKVLLEEKWDLNHQSLIEVLVWVVASDRSEMNIRFNPKSGLQRDFVNHLFADGNQSASLTFAGCCYEKAKMTGECWLLGQALLVLGAVRAL